MIENPVLIKELRTQMRGARSFIIVCVYDLILIGVLTLSAAVMLAPFSSYINFRIGRNLFMIVISIQMTMVCLISPAYTAGAITSERAQQTFELLIATLIRPSEIIQGKIGAAILYIVLLLSGSLPILSLLFLVGGFSPGEALATYALTFPTAVLLSSAGFMNSTIFRKTASAQAFSFGFMLMMTVGTLIVAGLAATFSHVPFNKTYKNLFEFLSNFILQFNPYSVLFSPLSDVGTGLEPLHRLLPPWAFQSIVFIGLSALFYLVSLWRLRRAGV